MYFCFCVPWNKKNLMFTYHDQFFLVPAFREISKNHERQFGVLIFSVKSQSRPTKSRTLLSFMKIFRENNYHVRYIFSIFELQNLSWNQIMSSKPNFSSKFCNTFVKLTFAIDRLQIYMALCSRKVQNVKLSLSEFTWNLIWWIQTVQKCHYWQF